jgi:hypothetical protein
MPIIRGYWKANLYKFEQFSGITKNKTVGILHIANVQRITNIAGVIPFLSANLALILFGLSIFNLVTGISSIVQYGSVKDY